MEARWGSVALAALVFGLACASPAQAGRAVVAPCSSVFCAEIASDGSRVVFPFEEELTPGAGKGQIYSRGGGILRSLLPPIVGYRPQLSGISVDASRVFVTTSLALAGEDTDGSGADIYEISGGAPTLISTGAGGGSAGGLAHFAGASPDGGSVFFKMFPPFPGDGSRCSALYRRTAGHTVIVAPDPEPPPAPICRVVEFGGVSADGTHLFFRSESELEDGDDEGDDIYQQVGSTYTRLTTYPEPEGTCVDVVRFADSSSDGGTVLFSTNSPIVGEDTDSTGDVYKRRPDGSFVLVSLGSDGGTGTCGFGGDRPIALSADGATAIFETTARLSAADRDSSNDLYSARDGEPAELLSTGPTDPNTDERSISWPDWLALVSDDAKRVVFETSQRLVAEDRDSAVDVYLREQGQTKLVSAAPRSAAPINANVELHAFSGNGMGVVFATKERLASKDVDRDRDIYLHWIDSGRSALLSTETFAPKMRISKRASRARKGGVAIRLRCPKAETSGPCRGRLTVKRSRSGPRLGGASFEIAAGRVAAVEVRLRRRPAGRSVFVRVKGRDAVGNARTIGGRVRIPSH